MQPPEDRQNSANKFPNFQTAFMWKIAENIICGKRKFVAIKNNIADILFTPYQFKKRTVKFGAFTFFAAGKDF